MLKNLPRVRRIVLYVNIFVFYVLQMVDSKRLFPRDGMTNDAREQHVANPTRRSKLTITSKQMSLTMEPRQRCRRILTMVMNMIKRDITSLVDKKLLASKLHNTGSHSLLWNTICNLQITTILRSGTFSLFPRRRSLSEDCEKSF